MEKISELAKLFAKYKIYPKDCYNDCSSVKVFQRMFPKNYYSKALETFFSYQNYKPTQRGADLPWWGKEYFSDNRRFRVMVIGQDSLAKDAGSVVFLMPFMSEVSNEEEYGKLIKRTDNNFSFKSWARAKEIFMQQWNIKHNYLYVTDGIKVYKNGSCRDKDFNRQKSKELLEKEIDFCNPDLIIILGESPLKLLDKTKKYALAVESGETILIKDKKCVVSPFLIGMGLTQPNFKRRLEIASNLIRKLIDK